MNGIFANHAYADFLQVQHSLPLAANLFTYQGNEDREPLQAD